jgi:hypothetical protein
MMKRTFISMMFVLAGTLASVSPMAAFADEGIFRAEIRHHPNMEMAMQDLEDAINHMNAAPNGLWGGHKGEAARHAQIALEEMRKAVGFRAHADHEWREHHEHEDRY